LATGPRDFPGKKRKSDGNNNSSSWDRQILVHHVLATMLKTIYKQQYNGSGGMDGWMDGLVEWIGFGPAGTQPSESITTEPRKPYSHEFDKVM
jgi:hypothetical protein